MSKYTKSCFYVALFIFSVLFGIRYGVGIDYFSYLEIYQTGTGLDRLELIFQVLIKGFNKLSFPFQVFLGTVAFFQLFFYTRAIRDFEWKFPEILPLSLFVFLFGGYWILASNILRQVLAIGVIAYSLSYLIKKNYGAFIFFAVLSILCHKTAIVPLVIVLFINYFGVFIPSFSVRIQLTILLVSVLLSIYQPNLAGLILDRFSHMVNLIGYGGYIDNQLHATKIYAKTPLGLGWLLGVMINALLVFYSRRVILFFDSRLVSLVYKLSFIGMLLHYIFICSQLVCRLNFYFYNLVAFVATFTLVYLYRTKNKKVWFLVGGYLLLHLGIMMKLEKYSAVLYFFN